MHVDMLVADTIVETGVLEPLLLGSEKNEEDEDEQQEYDDPSDKLSEESREPVTSIMSAYRLLTPSVKVCLIYRAIFEKCGTKTRYKRHKCPPNPYHLK